MSQKRTCGKGFSQHFYDALYLAAEPNAPLRKGRGKRTGEKRNSIEELPLKKRKARRPIVVGRMKHLRGLQNLVAQALGG